MSHPKFRRDKEDFNSVGGASINLGHFRNKSHSSADFKATFNMHDTVQPQTQLALPPKGLATTKFGPGFSRRNESQIKELFGDNDLARRTEQFQQLKASRSQVMSQARLQTLREADYRSGFNIINHQEVVPERAALSSSARGQGIRVLPNQGLGPEAPLRGRATLRETEGRFFLPHASGKSHEYRQDVLHREGINEPKAVSILQLGKKDLPTFGIDDQFGKSEYVQHSAATRRGLYEATQPGKFTPRKVDGHPGGDPRVVQSWTTDIDLNNRTISPALRQHRHQHSTRPF